MAGHAEDPIVLQRIPPRHIMPSCAKRLRQSGHQGISTASQGQEAAPEGNPTAEERTGFFAVTASVFLPGKHSGTIPRTPKREGQMPTIYKSGRDVGFDPAVPASYRFASDELRPGQ